MVAASVITKGLSYVICRAVIVLFIVSSSHKEVYYICFALFCTLFEIYFSSVCVNIFLIMYNIRSRYSCGLYLGSRGFFGGGRWNEGDVVCCLLQVVH